MGEQDPLHSITLTIQHGSKTHDFSFPECANLLDLSNRVSEELSIPPGNQKFLISPKPGLVTGPFDGEGANEHAGLPLRDLRGIRKINLLGSTAAQVSSLNAAVAASKGRGPSGRATSLSSAIKTQTPSRTRDWRSLHDATTYTFLTIRPLPYLPHPERSTRFLERLRDDPGIKTVMGRHKWTVPLLTEMNPADHTTHEGRTLGLNRNGGEVIELRLRTDAYDGYRDYRTIRKTLCHELTHNVHGEHDSQFWELCKQVEREVERDDWRSGGRALTSDEFYETGDDGGMVPDHGAWTGGEFVLGGGESLARDRGAQAPSAGDAALSRREILARAAEERVKKTRESNPGDDRN